MNDCQRNGTSNVRRRQNSEKPASYFSDVDKGMAARDAEQGDTPSNSTLQTERHLAAIAGMNHNKAAGNTGGQPRRSRSHRARY